MTTYYRKLSMLRYAALITCPCALRTTHAGSIWQGIVAKQPVHPMSALLADHLFEMQCDAMCDFGDKNWHACTAQYTAK